MKTRHYILLLLVALACGLSMSAQERRLVIDNHTSFSQYPVEEVEEVVFHERLASPAAVKAVVSGNQVMVGWQPVKGSSSYAVERSADGLTYTAIGTSDEAGFTDTAPLLGSNLYRVMAISDSGENSDFSLPSNKVDFQPADLSATGLYMGIIGFNRDVTARDMAMLMPSNVSDFTTYVGNLTQAKGTLLYHSVGEAIDMLSSSSLPDDVTSVSIVTFTDGLDQGSLMKSNDGVTTSDAYLSNLQQRIANTIIAGKHISAYSIGLRGADVKDVDSFRNHLANLASSPDNAAEVTNLSELNVKFKEIAGHLSETTETQLIKAILTGNPGTKFRLTFDDIAEGSSAAESELYIEGTYTRSRDDEGNMHYYFSDISYVGISCSSTDKIEGEMRDDGLVFAFDGVAKSDGTKLSLYRYKRWRYIPSLDFWQPDEEGGGVSSVTSETTYKSAAIVLVLDCSTSLGGQFSTVKSHANDFIRQMAANTVENEEAQWRTIGTGRFYDGKIAHLAGLSPMWVEVMIQQSTAASGRYRLIKPWARMGSDANLIIDASRPQCVRIEPQNTGVVVDETSGEIWVASQSYVRCNAGGLSETRFLSGYPTEIISLADGVFDFSNESIACRYPDSTNAGYDSTRWTVAGNSGMRLILPGISDSRIIFGTNGKSVAVMAGSDRPSFGIYMVDWGDGNVEQLQGGIWWNHTYASDGGHTIIAEGAPLNYIHIPSSGLTSFMSTSPGYIRSLSLPDNDITEIDFSGYIALETSYLPNNALTELKPGDAGNISSLDCSGNKLKVLDLSAFPSLRSLDCSRNDLTSLTPANAMNLSYLTCSDNNLTTLDCTKCSALQKLDCSRNALTELNFGALWQYKSALPLKELFCSENQLTNVVMTRLTSLDVFDASHNRLAYTGFDSCASLKKLNLSYNNLSGWMDLAGNRSLEWVDCSNNRYSGSFFNNPALSYLDISANAFASLDISDAPVLVDFICSGNPGENGIFNVISGYASANIPSGFTVSPWNYEGGIVTPVYGVK